MKGVVFMGRKSKISVEIKLETLDDYINGNKTMSQICAALQINPSSVEDWLRKYKTFGKEGLITESHNTKYSSKIKVQAVNDYLNGKGSLSDICVLYKISSRSILRRWIKQYNDHNIVKFKNTKGATIMTKGRKTTYEERVDIVSFCIANANDYNLTSNKYDVSYQQVYTWMKKYKKDGYNALVDRRGRHKRIEELSESDKTTAHLKLLKAENKRLKMENDFLKKLKEIERR